MSWLDFGLLWLAVALVVILVLIRAGRNAPIRNDW